MYQPCHILVTGGAGFIGANFVRYVLAHDPLVRVINLDLLTYAGSLKNLDTILHSPRHIFIQGDIQDQELVTRILNQNEIDTIVHFAAESHVDRSIESPASFIKTNIQGTFTLLEAARLYWLAEKNWKETDCRFHHISTDEVFGSLKKSDSPFTEQTRYAPNSPYAASKASSDHLVRAYYHTFGLPMTISNCSNNYGPYQHSEKLIPTIIRACQNWKTIPIYGDGSHIRDWLYVEDHCAGILAILEHGKVGETYNLGGNNEMNNIMVTKQICDLMDAFYPKKESHHSLMQFVTDRLGHDWRYAIDAKKMFSHCGWQALESFSSGIHKTIEFYHNGYKFS